MNGEAGAALAFGILAAIVLLIGFRRGFFAFQMQGEWVLPIRIFHVIGAFAIYFAATYLLSGVAVAILRSQIAHDYILLSSWLNFIISLAIFIFLLLYWRAISPSVRKGILRAPQAHHPLIEDVWAAFTAWVLAFPLVLFLSQAIELIIANAFGITHVPDQLAVKFLKSTFDSPLFFILATISIVILAPLIEETLFRGFLQSYIRQHLGSKQAMVITSVCFSLFHFSASQGVSNVSIIISLFVLSLFLGFLYEKQRSLLAPMALHACFNGVSVINLYLFGGFTTGL